MKAAQLVYGERAFPSTKSIGKMMKNTFQRLLHAIRLKPVDFLQEAAAIRIQATYRRFAWNALIQVGACSTFINFLFQKLC